MSSRPLPEIAAANWPGLRLVSEVDEGNRNEVWKGDLDGMAVSIRRSRRSPASLAWELELIAFLGRNGFWVPEVIPAHSGARSADGVIVQRWLDGDPPTNERKWNAVADELQRLHNMTIGYQQRPDCCATSELESVRRSVDADLDAMPSDAATLVLSIFAEFRELPTCVVHGDPGPSNIRIDADGRVGLLDWDESRVDVPWHDLSNLGIQVLDHPSHNHAVQLSHAWEATNAWSAEPAYARKRLQRLA